MAEISFQIAVLFATQVATGTYNAALDTLATPIADTDGLLLGDGEVGLNGSGLTWGLERIIRAKAVLAGGSGLTIPISQFLREENPSFSFAVPFGGGRNDAGAAVTDADMDLSTHLPGLDALLESVGLVGAASGTPGHIYKFATPNPMSALIFYWGNRIELLDCRSTMSIDFTPGNIAIATFNVSVGAVKDHSLQAFPTITTFGQQAAESLDAVGVPVTNFTWGNPRSQSALVLDVTPDIQDIPDSEALSGVRKALAGRETQVTATIWADDATDAEFDHKQLVATAAGTLTPLSFTVGAAATINNPVKSVKINIPQPELITSDLEVSDLKAATVITARASHTTADSELEIEFL